MQLNVDGSHGEVRISIDKRMKHKTGQWTFTARLLHWLVKDRWKQSHLKEGFQTNQCEPICEDSIEHAVKWKEASLESLPGQTVRLYIYHGAGRGPMPGSV